MPRTVSASEAKNKLGSIVGWVLQNKDEVIVENHGAPTVVIVSYTEYEKMKALINLPLLLYNSLLVR